ncbi:hypothetical protein IFM89_031431, partial [Coptis chinensis]
SWLVCIVLIHNASAKGFAIGVGLKGGLAVFSILARLKSRRNFSSVRKRVGMLSNGEAVVVACANVKAKDEVPVLSVVQPYSPRSKGVDEKFIVQGPESPSKGYDSSTGSSRSGRGRTEHDHAGRYKTNNKVAIFRDRDVNRKDPDYDRSYDSVKLNYYCRQLPIASRHGWALPSVEQPSVPNKTTSRRAKPPEGRA